MSKQQDAFSLLGDLLAPYRPLLKRDFGGYRNHCHRVLGYAMARLPKVSDDSLRMLAIATAFHDVGLWTENTLDYLSPSAELARDYLTKSGLSHWGDEVEALITWHHKITPYRGSYPMVEAFRKADLADLSMGWIASGSRGLKKELARQFPNAGFHKGLLLKATRWICRHPFHPAPMFKW